MKASTDEGLQKENWFYVEFYRKVEEPDIFWLTSLSLYIKKQNQKTETRIFTFNLIIPDFANSKLIPATRTFPE